MTTQRSQTVELKRTSRNLWNWQVHMLLMYTWYIPPLGIGRLVSSVSQ